MIIDQRYLPGGVPVPVTIGRLYAGLFVSGAHDYEVNVNKDTQLSFFLQEIDCEIDTLVDVKPTLVVNRPGAASWEQATSSFHPAAPCGTKVAGTLLEKNCPVAGHAGYPSAGCFLPNAGSSDDGDVFEDASTVDNVDVGGCPVAKASGMTGARCGQRGR